MPLQGVQRKKGHFTLIFMGALSSHVASESLVEKLVIFLFSNETIGSAFFSEHPARK